MFIGYFSTQCLLYFVCFCAYFGAFTLEKEHSILYKIRARSYYKKAGLNHV